MVSVVVLVLSYSILSLGGTVVGHGCWDSDGSYFVSSFVFDDDNK